MRKKVGVITFHKTYNYGAAIQAYATVELLKAEGFEVEIIDYYSNNLQGYGTFRNAFNEASNSNRSFAGKAISAAIKTPSYKLLKKRFDSFVNTELPVTKQYYSSEELENDLPKVDYFCTGSDQVWNNYYTHYFDKAYFLDFAPDNSKCFSIAASFGKEEFNDEENDYIMKQLEKYDFISIREKAGVMIARSLGYNAAQLMLDPTLLVEKNTWEDFIESSAISEPYVLLYQLHGDSGTYEIAKEYAKRKGIKLVRIVTMFHQMHFGSINIVVPSVHRFLGLIKDADYVFTDSFHGTVFSHLFGKRLAITLPKKFGDRITTLLSEVGTEGFVCSDMDKWEKFVSEVDYNEVGAKIDALRNQYRSILSEYLDTLKDENKDEG